MNSLRVGLLLGLRQLQRASRWTTTLIVFVMMITFLNLVAVSGILVGLIVGSERAFERSATGNLTLSTLDGEDFILQADVIANILEHTPGVQAYSIRYAGAGTITADYRSRQKPTDEPDETTARLTGIDPRREASVTNLADSIVEGDYFFPDDTNALLIGSLNIKRYSDQFPDLTNSLDGAYPGDTVLLTIGTVSREFIVRGIIDSKVGEISSAIFIPERELRRITNRPVSEASRIAVRLEPTADPDVIKAMLLNAGVGELAKVRTFQEALPKFLIDIKNTFNVLGTFIGSIGIIVASITIFIIIFINALSRRQQIGILKGIGIDRRAIEIAYVFQAAIYALAGSLLGVIIIYGFLIGYFERNPINFPFSDGILVAEPTTTLTRFIILFVITLIAGLIPAWMIARQNTLNAILGRNK
jgi:ABC-type lipoprotein release transport system permease subunit